MSVVALVISVRALRADRPGLARRFDAAGSVIFTAAIGALTYGMIRAGEYGWNDPVCLPVLCVGAASLLAVTAFEADRS